MRICSSRSASAAVRPDIGVAFVGLGIISSLAVGELNTREEDAGGFSRPFFKPTPDRECVQCPIVVQDVFETDSDKVANADSRLACAHSAANDTSETTPRF